MIRAEAKKRVYLDYAATTPLDDEVLAAMEPFLHDGFGNANALYREGREAFSALEDARKRVSRLLGAKRPSEIIFTSGGTESDNLALFGLVQGCQRSNKPVHIIVSEFEHHAVLEPAKRLASYGNEVSYLKPRSDGFVHPDDLRDLLRPDTALVSIMMANNELGTVQPVKDLAAVAHSVGAVFHTDAVQSLGKCGFELEETGIDAASFSGHKIYGPKGVGALYLRRKTPFRAQMLGGGQEMGLRSGTQNVAGAIGFAHALEIAQADRQSENERLRTLQSFLVEELLAASPRIRLAVDPMAQSYTSDSMHYLPNIVSILVEGMESETMILRLDDAGFATSAGSACSSGSLDPSHVLLSIGIPSTLAYGSLRISMGRGTTDEELKSFIGTFTKIIS